MLLANTFSIKHQSEEGTDGGGPESVIPMTVRFYQEVFNLLAGTKQTLFGVKLISP